MDNSRRHQGSMAVKIIDQHRRYWMLMYEDGCKMAGKIPASTVKTWESVSLEMRRLPDDCTLDDLRKRWGELKTFSKLDELTEQEIRTTEVLLHALNTLAQHIKDPEHYGVRGKLPTWTQETLKISD